MASSSGENEFNTINFEKKLTSLKDSQESINNCCHWCLESRQHHKKIVNCWLNVLKRVRVEQRLTLFYLANDVIQYSKRRNYDFVESWSTTLQKATTLVRDEKIKHRILRIFKIWEQRGIYGEEFITDLSGLISVTPTARKSDDPQEFQSQYLTTKIKNCAKLECDTDLKLKKFKEHNPKMMDGEALCASLKDRAHVDDVEKEMDEYVNHMEAYVSALKSEIKARHHLISLLQQADVNLDTDKKDVKLVANAYRAFALRVKTLKKKLEEMMPALNSPVPSPDINAPSPSPDSDLELPASTHESPKPLTPEVTQLTYTNAGFYNPVPPVATTENSNFHNNGFSSFLGGSMPFNIENISSVFNTSQSSATAQNTNANETVTTDIYNSNNSISSLFPSLSQPPPPPDTAPTPMPVAPPSANDYQFNSQVPLMPPPIPPFSKSDVSYNNSYTDSYSNDTSTNFAGSNYNPPNNSYPLTPNTAYPPPIVSYQTSQSTTASNFQSQTSYSPSSQNFQTTGTNSFESPPPNFTNTFVPPPPPGPSYTSAEEYNPEEEPETWDNEGTWDQPPIDLETPESPPNFEKEAYSEPVEYHDNQTMGAGIDIDHRLLSINPEADNTHRKKDVDHRNLISLTGSPKENNQKKSWKMDNADKDYRTSKLQDTGDQDYRMHFNFENLQLPPPPPPPKQISPLKSLKKHGQSPRKPQDNVESIDMDLSDDDNLHEGGHSLKETFNDNLKVITIIDDDHSLEPPPPFPEFSDEADANANNLLDDLNNDLDESDDLLSVLGQHTKMDMLDVPMFDGPMHRVWNNPVIPNMQPVDVPPPLLITGPHHNMRNGPPPQDMLVTHWHQEYHDFRGRGNKRGNFNNRGDFRGRQQSRGSFSWRGRGGNFRFNNNRGGAHGNNRSRPPFFRGRFRGGY